MAAKAFSRIVSLRLACCGSGSDQTNLAQKWTAPYVRQVYPHCSCSSPSQEEARSGHDRGTEKLPELPSRIRYDPDRLKASRPRLFLATRVRYCPSTMAKYGSWAWIEWPERGEQRGDIFRNGG